MTNTAEVKKDVVLEVLREQHEQKFNELFKEALRQICANYGIYPPEVTLVLKRDEDDSFYLSITYSYQSQLVEQKIKRLRDICEVTTECAFREIAKMNVYKD